LLRDGESMGEYMVTACNEVVNFINLNTNEIRYKIYNHEAEHGFVTHLKASSNVLAIGFSSGTILVYDLDIASKLDGGENEPFNLLHKFQFHRTGISVIFFDDLNTQMFSGGQDTYIVVYDLVSDQA
jgi:WD40 repeat protein